MKLESPDGQNESTEKPWPSVHRIANHEEFQQSFAVAQLAVELWQESNTSNVKSIAKASPKDFLADAWELIESAREHVLRAQTNAEYLVALGGSDEAAENVVRRILSASRVSFEKVCDPERRKGDTEVIKLSYAVSGKTIAVDWKMYRGEGGERAFEALFWDYWNATSRIEDEAQREAYGRRVLASWKREGIPPNDFLALAEFRRARDKKRAANLVPTPRRKPR